MKIIFIAPKTSTFLNYRGQLMKDIINKGHEIVAIVPENECDDEFKKIGAKKVVLALDKSSMSLIKNLKYFLGLIKILKKEKPDKVFSYTIKPVIFGSIAAHFVKVNEIYSLICGLGYIYSIKNLKTYFLRIICGCGYKLAFTYNKKVIFQNEDDINDFVRKNIIKRNKTDLVNGSGVDLELFKKNKLPNNNSFIMISRVIKEKGINEYFEAAKIIKNKYPKAKFTYIGAYDNSYKKDFLKIKRYIDDGTVKYIPETNMVANFIKKHDVIVLPTYYREGVPKTLLEASAMARPIITTYTPGCKETVVDGVNGFFVEPRNAIDLAEKMELMINNKNLQEMGEESYKICTQKFDIKLVNKRMMKIMQIN